MGGYFEEREAGDNYRDLSGRLRLDSANSDDEGREELLKTGQ